MKISAFQYFKIGFAISVGYELGRMVPGVTVRFLNKQFVEDVKTEYRRRSNANNSGFRVVPFETKGSER